jgi:pilus assembly protein Flp/PilA
MKLFTQFVSDDEGQDLIEYSLLCALIAVACITAMSTLATDINNLFAGIGGKLKLP